MQPYQEEYVRNLKEIADLRRFYRDGEPDFERWYQNRRECAARIRMLSRENNELLGRELFPALDGLFGADSALIADLEEFSDTLMDWKTNLDIGVYVAIHDALLSLYRIRKSRNDMIRELYKLGMGLYYLRTFLTGVDDEESDALRIRNGMFFTEAASYLRYFEEIDDEATRGYIIRALANIALCSKDYKSRINASSRTLRILRDQHYRKLAPGLPWQAFLRATHQQMSTYRAGLSRGNLTTAELSEVLDSCYEVFKPEEQADNPSIRWLWPYYEMEYNCGYVNLKTTLDRMEELITATKYDQYDMSGLYGNVQLAIYYGRFMRDNPSLREEEKRVRFLEFSYRKMLETMMTCPPELFDNYFVYIIASLISGFYEMEGGLSYREVMELLMQRYAGELYVRSRRAGEMMRVISAAVFDANPRFFDEIPQIGEISNPGIKREALLAYACDCGLFCDFGLLKMNFERTIQSRSLFENEYQMSCLHTVSGWDDLSRRASTAAFADIALGHHAYYSGAGGYPKKYVRNTSPYRQMTDIAAVVSSLCEEWEKSPGRDVSAMLPKETGRFSPVILSFVQDAGVSGQLLNILSGDDRPYYRTIHQKLFSLGNA